MTPEEVNRFLAEKLMGWHIRPLSDKERLQGFERIPIYHKENGEQSGYSATGQCNTIRFDPYHNITQALGDGKEGTVVGAMHDLGWFVNDMCQNPVSKLWHFGFFKEQGAAAVASTPSAAICEAAIKVMEGSDGR